MLTTSDTLEFNNTSGFDRPKTRRIKMRRYLLGQYSKSSDSGFDCPKTRRIKVRRSFLGRGSKSLDHPKVKPSLCWKSESSSLLSRNSWNHSNKRERVAILENVKKEIKEIFQDIRKVTSVIETIETEMQELKRDLNKHLKRKKKVTTTQNLTISSSSCSEQLFGLNSSEIDYPTIATLGLSSSSEECLLEQPAMEISSWKEMKALEEIGTVFMNESSLSA